MPQGKAGSAVSKPRRFSQMLADELFFMAGDPDVTGGNAGEWLSSQGVTGADHDWYMSHYFWGRHKRLAPGSYAKARPGVVPARTPAAPSAAVQLRDRHALGRWYAQQARQMQQPPLPVRPHLGVENGPSTPQERQAYSDSTAPAAKWARAMVPPKGRVTVRTYPLAQMFTHDERRRALEMIHQSGGKLLSDFPGFLQQWGDARERRMSLASLKHLWQYAARLEVETMEGAARTGSYQQNLRPTLAGAVPNALGHAYAGGTKALVDFAAGLPQQALSRHSPLYPMVQANAELRQVMGPPKPGESLRQRLARGALALTQPEEWRDTATDLDSRIDTAAQELPATSALGAGASGAAEKLTYDYVQKQLGKGLPTGVRPDIKPYLAANPRVRQAMDLAERRVQRLVSENPELRRYLTPARARQAVLDATAQATFDGPLDQIAKGTDDPMTFIKGVASSTGNKFLKDLFGLG